MSSLKLRAIPVTAAAALLAFAGCSSDNTCDPYPYPGALSVGQAAFGPRMDCALGVEFQQRSYSARVSADVPDLGDPISGVVLPDCNDTGGPQGPDIPVTAHAVGDY